MSNNLPATTPAETVNISPEALEIANCYLQTQDLGKVAEQLGVSTELITQTLGKREVKAYVDHVFFNLGFNNRFKLRKLMDTIISKKLQDMDEAGVGSTKDITEILTLSHKMTMDVLNAEIAIEKMRTEKVKTQTNIQINNNEGGSKYDGLMRQLLSDGDILDA